MIGWNFRTLANRLEIDPTKSIDLPPQKNWSKLFVKIQRRRQVQIPRKSNSTEQKISKQRDELLDREIFYTLEEARTLIAH